MSEIVFSVRNLQFAYDGEPVLRGINLTVAAGEIMGLVGADGAGKTTLLRIAVGQLQANSGNITLLGEDPSDPALRNDIAYMPQGFGLYQDLSVAENLFFFADLHGLSRGKAGKRIADLLMRTGLAGFEARRAGQLSGGMMQKLALSCALVSAPRMMFLDEPTTGVDPVSRRAFWQLLDGVRSEGVAIFYATANMDEAERCDRVALLQDGRLSRQGTPLALADPGAMQLVAVSGPAVRDYRMRLRDFPGVRLVFAVGPRLRIWLEGGADLQIFTQAVAGLSAGLKVEVAHPSLHDTALRDLALRETAHGEHAA
jgi:drug efflux transport system ATP-binding protein